MEPEALPDISYTGPILDIPNPPADLKYDQYEDYRCRQILEGNGIALDPTSLVGALESERDILLACAAHTAGANRVGAAIPSLITLSSSSDDLVQVEAAYALVRLGHAAGTDVLVRALDRPLPGYPSTVIAAGYLAQLGDARGFATIAEGLGSDLAAIKMSACKQLYFFMPFHGQRSADNREIDVVALFARALDDPDPNVQWQGLVQISQLDASAFQSVLKTYVDTAADPSNLRVAEDILSRSQDTR